MLVPSIFRLILPCLGCALILLDNFHIFPHPKLSIRTDIQNQPKVTPGESFALLVVVVAMLCSDKLWSIA